MKNLTIKSTIKYVFIGMCLLLTIGCSKEAERAANAKRMNPDGISDYWYIEADGVEIYFVKTMGDNIDTYYSARLEKVGVKFPREAKNGIVLSKVTFVRGGYWEGIYCSYFPASGNKAAYWKDMGTVGLAMSEDAKEFRIGSAVYKRGRLPQ